MAEKSTRQGNLETACWGLRPTMGHNGCIMMMMMNRFDKSYYIVQETHNIV